MSFFDSNDWESVATPLFHIGATPIKKPPQRTRLSRTSNPLLAPKTPLLDARKETISLANFLNASIPLNQTEKELFSPVEPFEDASLVPSLEPSLKDDIEESLSLGQSHKDSKQDQQKHNQQDQEQDQDQIQLLDEDVVMQDTTPSTPNPIIASPKTFSTAPSFGITSPLANPINFNAFNINSTPLPSPYVNTKPIQAFNLVRTNVPPPISTSPRPGGTGSKRSALASPKTPASPSGTEIYGIRPRKPLKKQTTDPGFVFKFPTPLGFESGFESTPSNFQASNAHTASPPTHKFYSSTAEELRHLANELYKEKKYDEALEKYSQGMLVAPNDALLALNRCATYLAMHQPQYALSDAKIAISLDKTLVKAYVRAARSAMLLGNLRDAQAWIKMGHEQGDVSGGLLLGQEEALINRTLHHIDTSEALLKSGEYRLALRHVEDAILALDSSAIKEGEFIPPKHVFRKTVPKEWIYRRAAILIAHCRWTDAEGAIKYVIVFKETNMM
jgi:tetratricopeptide (TPR) repeat protein